MEAFTGFKQVENNINALAKQNVSWSVPVTHEAITEARSGWADIVISGSKPLPRAWFPASMRGVRLLCLAGAGGQQAPLCAAMGAEVTVLDLSEVMLGRDRDVAKREKLAIRLEHGNMCDLSRFSDESFDLILNPPSLFYVPDILPVYRECRRVLKPGGVLILCAPNPANYLCDYEPETGRYIACNRLPYKSYEHADQGDWIEFGHTLDDYLGGLTRNGFYLTDFFEDGFDDTNNQDSADFVETCFVLRALKR